jgi:hypothetical protein
LVSSPSLTFLCDWEEILHGLGSRKFDVYSEPRYFRLNQSANQKMEAVLYKEGAHLLMLPYLKKSLSHENAEYFDFESPHGYGGPITNCTETDFLKRAGAVTFNALKDRGAVAGFVRYNPMLSNSSYLHWEDHPKVECQTVLMDLKPTSDEIWEKQIHSKHRNVIRKARDSGLTFRIDRDFSEIESFKALYRMTMGRLAADQSYLYSDDYFQNLVRDFRSRGFLALVESAGKIIAASVILTDKVSGHYHLSGSQLESQALYPNNLMIYETAIFLKSEGYEHFHLGGGGRRVSLFDFKKRFSTFYPDFYIGKYIFNQSVYQSLSQKWTLANPLIVPKYENFFLKYRVPSEGISENE